MPITKNKSTIIRHSTRSNSKRVMTMSKNIPEDALIFYCGEDNYVHFAAIRSFCRIRIII